MFSGLGEGRFDLGRCDQRKHIVCILSLGPFFATPFINQRDSAPPPACRSGVRLGDAR